MWRGRATSATKLHSWHSFGGRHVTKQSDSIVHHTCVGHIRRLSPDIRVSGERPKLLLQEPVRARQGSDGWQGGRSRRAAPPDGAGRMRHCASGFVRQKQRPAAVRAHLRQGVGQAGDPHAALRRKRRTAQGNHFAGGSRSSTGTGARWWMPSRPRHGTKSPIAGTPSSSSSTNYRPDFSPRRRTAARPPRSSGIGSASSSSCWRVMRQNMRTIIAA